MGGTETYLALDLGATSGRAVAGHFDGQVLRLEEVHRFANGPVERDGHLHWNLPALLAQVEISLAKAASQAPGLVSVGCDAWGLDHGFVDAGGQVLEWPFAYLDARTAEVAGEVVAAFSAAELVARTGCIHSPISTLHQLVATRRHRPDLLDRADRLLFLPDLVHHHLCGARSAETTLASTTQLWSWRDRGWDAGVMDRLGLPRRILPDLVEAGASLGLLDAGVCGRTGVGAVAVTAPGCHDTTSAVAVMPSAGNAASGAVDLLISSGTWSMLAIRVAEPVVSAEAAAEGCGTYALPGPSWALMRGVMGLWLVERFMREEGITDPAALAGEAEAAGPARMLIRPENPRFQGGEPLRGALESWGHATNQPLPLSRGEVARCLFESLALFYAESLDRMVRLCGSDVRGVFIAGGGSRNRLLNRLTANATGLPVRTSIAEMTVAGNILAQAIGRGRLASFDEAREVVARSWPVTTVEPEPQSAWAERRGQFAALGGGKAP